MKIMVVGGTGLLGYHAVRAGLERGHTLCALAVDDIDLSGWYPRQVAVRFGDVLALTESELQEIFSGCDALVYAVGPDDRVVPPAPAYGFFHERLVEACGKAVTAARKAGENAAFLLTRRFGRAAACALPFSAILSQKADKRRGPPLVSG